MILNFTKNYFNFYEMIYSKAFQAKLIFLSNLNLILKALKDCVLKSKKKY